MIISIIIFIFTLLILVLIHELGHFLLAKKFNIKVLEFGFGIPPRLVGKKFGETLISINWLPFGGFVRLFGEDEVDKKILENHRSFAAQKVSKRIMVVVAGVLMNLILAWLLFYTVLIFQNFRIIYPTKDPQVFVAQVEKGFPAEGAGVKSGEKLLSINEEQIKDIDQARNIIRSKEGVPLELTLSDIDGEIIRTVSVIPKKDESGNVLIGVIFSPIAFKTYDSSIEKIFSGITYSWDLTRLTFSGLGDLLKDITSGNLKKASESVAGPVGLASVTNNILSLGIEAILPYVWFVGLISLTLAIFNVLPIPALDGGRLLFLLLEAILGRRIHVEVEKWVHTIGMAILLTLAVLIAFSDIGKLVT